MSEWISVEDQPFPKEDIEFLAFQNMGNGFTRISIGVWVPEHEMEAPEGVIQDEHNACFAARWLTHWQPLPTPPKEPTQPPNCS